MGRIGVGDCWDKQLKSHMFTNHISMRHIGSCPKQNRAGFAQSGRYDTNEGGEMHLRPTNWWMGTLHNLFTLEQFIYQGPTSWWTETLRNLFILEQFIYQGYGGTCSLVVNDLGDFLL